MATVDFPRDLQQRFESAIVNGRIPSGFRAAAEKFAADFGASLADMRRVLESAHRKGLVQPAGDEFEILAPLNPSVESLFQHTSRAGLAPSSSIRRVVVEPAAEHVARRLQVDVGSPVYRLERTRIVNEEAIANQVNFIPYEVCPGLEDDDMSHHSFQRLLEGKYHAVVADVREEVALQAAGAEDQAVLGLQANSPVLVVQRLSLSRTGQPLVWADIHIRPDRYHYVASLWPQAAHLLNRAQNH